MLNKINTRYQTRINTNPVQSKDLLITNKGKRVKGVRS